MDITLDQLRAAVKRCTPGAPDSYADRLWTELQRQQPTANDLLGCTRKRHLDSPVIQALLDEAAQTRHDPIRGRYRPAGNREWRPIGS